MKFSKQSVGVLLLSFTSLASGTEFSKELANSTSYSHPRWCELSAKREVGPYINAAAGFVEMDPVLLAVGMSSEGFAVKNDCVTSKESLDKDVQDVGYISQVRRLCQTDKFVGYGISTIDKTQTKAKPEEWKNAQEYAPAGAKFGAIDPTSGLVEMLTPREMIQRTYYGNSWTDDGSDTFGLEYRTLREKNYLPKKFVSSDYKDVTGTSFETLPDFVFMTDQGDVNEPARNRFISSDGSYMGRIGRQSPTKGDPGRTQYKTPEAQTFANAALWKNSFDKFESAKKELIAYYRSKGPSSPEYARIAGLERPLSNVEKAFWSKVFYNGGQGTQAAAWDVLKQFADNNWLASDKYLTADPGVKLKEVYNNGRHVSDSYATVIKSSGCSDLLAQRAGDIKLEDYKDFSGNTNSDPSSSQKVNKQ
jgi:hypothetical protein